MPRNYTFEIVNFSFTNSDVGTLERNFKTIMLRKRRKSNDIGLQKVFYCDQDLANIPEVYYKKDGVYHLMSLTGFVATPIENDR